MLRNRMLSVFPMLACCFLPLALLCLPLMRAQNPPDPWTVSQTVQPADFAKELASAKQPPTILFVGFERLYTAGRIKGAQYHGSGGHPDGVEQIKKWAEPLPRPMNLVIYCGCCPMQKCPNVRPAFIKLQEMGFSHLRVLILPTSFAVDWADKGLPYEK